MAYAFSLASWLVIGGAGVFALGVACHEAKAAPRRIRALLDDRHALGRDDA